MRHPLNIPLDINAETLLNYLSHADATVDLKGTHKRNAYEDILSIVQENGRFTIELSRESIYDILPEALFHPIDRFENIPPNEYKERFAEEYEAQQMEEENARRFFAPFDKFILGIGCEVNRIKNDDYKDNSVLSEIICDNMSERYMNNRFVRKLIPYTPLCRRMRGDRDMIALALRKILLDDGIVMAEHNVSKTFSDQNPRYNSTMEEAMEQSLDWYIGNEYLESVTEYEIKYWKEEECTDSFLSFVSEIEVLEEFINDYFAGIETTVKFNISNVGLPIRLSDDLYYNYLDYNTNL